MENAFGILSAKWRVLRRPIALAPSRADQVVKAACCLHNILRNDTIQSRCPAASFPQEREGNHGMMSVTWDDSANEENGNTLELYSRREIRNQFAEYFANEGTVPWQINAVTRCA